MLADKILVVVGGSGLIGREVVKDIRKKHGLAINADINVTTDWEQGNFHFDVTDENAVKNGLAEIFAHYGRIDGLANCAYPRTADWGNKLEDVTIASWRQNVDMQLNAVFWTTQEVLKYLQKGGAIVNFGSIYGVVGNDFTVYEGTPMTSPPGYCAIKGGVINFTRYIASYVGHRGIRANCVSPGGVFDHQNPVFVANYSHKSPLKRMAQPQEIAPAVSFLLSDEASYITGHNLLVDGGWCAI